MIIIIKSLTSQSEGYRKILRHLVNTRIFKKGKVELLFSQSIHFNNLLVECELTLQLIGEDLQRIFAVGYSEEDVFTDVILKFKTLTDNKPSLLKLDKATT